MWSDLEEAPIPNINEFSQLFSRQAVEPKVAKKKVEQKKKTEVSFNSIIPFFELLIYFKHLYRNSNNFWIQKDLETLAY